MNIPLMLVIAAVAAPLCRADESLRLADELVDMSGSAASLQQNFETNLQPSLDRMKAQGAPAELIAKIHAVARQFYAQNFRWSEIKPQMAKLYTDSFTEAELREMIAFFKTPVGAKALARLPGVMQDGTALAMAQLQASMPEFSRQVTALIHEYQRPSSQVEPPSR
jgi:hypothetical protein